MEPEQAGEGEGDVVDETPETPGEGEGEETPETPAGGEKPAEGEKAGGEKPLGGEKPAAAKPKTSPAVDALVDPTKWPAWVKPHIDLADREGSELATALEELEDASPEVQRVIAMLLRRAQQQDAAIAQRIQKAAETDEAVQARARALQRQQAQTLAFVRNPKMKALLDGIRKEIEDAGDVDPFSPEGQAKAANALVLQRFQQFNDTLAAIEAEQQQAAEQADKQAELDKAKATMRAYMAEREEFKDPTFVARVKKIIADLGVQELRPAVLQRAHELALLQVATEQDDEATKAALARARSRVKPARGSGRAVPPTPVRRAGEDDDDFDRRRAAFYREHPDAQERDLEQAVRDGILV